MKKKQNIVNKLKCKFECKHLEFDAVNGDTELLFACRQQSAHVI